MKNKKKRIFNVEKYGRKIRKNTRKQNLENLLLWVRAPVSSAGNYLWHSVTSVGRTLGQRSQQFIKFLLFLGFFGKYFFFKSCNVFFVISKLKDRKNNDFFELKSVLRALEIEPMSAANGARGF